MALVNWRAGEAGRAVGACPCQEGPISAAQIIVIVVQIQSSLAGQSTARLVIPDLEVAPGGATKRRRVRFEAAERVSTAKASLICRGRRGKVLTGRRLEGAQLN